MSTHYNRKRLQGPIFQEETWSTSYDETSKQNDQATNWISRNLDRSKSRKPFQKSTTNFRYQQQCGYTDISYLIIGTSTTKRQTTGKIEVDDDQEYEAEQILDTRKQGQQQEYLVKWKGYGPEENTWEPTKHLTHCGSLLRQFNQQRSTS
ncbi:chromatin organization modifier domain-containing protein [Hirsutella rhossiliensis]